MDRKKAVYINQLYSNSSSRKAAVLISIALTCETEMKDVWVLLYWNTVSKYSGCLSLICACNFRGCLLRLYVLMETEKCLLSGILRHCPCPVSHLKNSCCLHSLKIPVAFSEAWKSAWLENPGHLWSLYPCCHLLPFAGFSWMPTFKIHRSCVVLHCLFYLINEPVWTGLAVSECILGVFHRPFILGLHNSMWL